MISHVAIWVSDLEKSRRFYEKYFNVKAGSKYYNQNKNFSSYFLSFEVGAKIELMHTPKVKGKVDQPQIGLAHFAISVGTKAMVNQLTNILRADGYIIYSEPRTTGDGYYESVILDPDGNQIEITV